MPVRYTLAKQLSSCLAFLHTSTPSIIIGEFIVFPSLSFDKLVGQSCSVWSLVGQSELYRRETISDRVHYVFISLIHSIHSNAPELYEKNDFSIYTKETDIYAFGVLLCELFLHQRAEEIAYPNPPYYGVYLSIEFYYE